MASKKYKAAVIGCGNIGVKEGNYQKAVRPGTHAAAYKKHPRIKLCGLADSDKKQLKEASKYFPGIPLFSSAKELLEKTSPDIVSVATRADSHSKLVKLASKHRVPAIVCEKPVACNPKEAKEMIEACRKSKSLLFVNHTRRFDPFLRKTAKDVRKGKLGRIFQATAYYYNGLFNNGTHLVDLLRLFMGEADWVWGMENEKTSFDEKTNVDGKIHFESGALASVQSLPKNYGFFEIYIYGSKGALFLKELGSKIEYRKLVKNKNYKGYFQLEKGKERGVSRSFMEYFPGQVVACLEGKEKPVSSGKDGLEALKILFALKESADKKGKVIKI